MDCSARFRAAQSKLNGAIVKASGQGKVSSSHTVCARGGVVVGSLMRGRQKISKSIAVICSASPGDVGVLRGVAHFVYQDARAFSNTKITSVRISVQVAAFLVVDFVVDPDTGKAPGRNFPIVEQYVFTRK